MIKLFAAAVLALPPFAASAVQVVLAPSNVIGSSGFYAGFNFEPGEILDQQTGTVTETFGTGYWINPDTGPANAFITIDLGAVTNLTSFTLFNTHNGPFADRGTGTSTILGSNSVTDLGGGQFGLVGGVSVASGTLSPETIGNPSPQSFAAAGSYRYISFNPTSVSVGGTPCCGTNVYGLNELRGIAAVPEPESWLLLVAGFGLVGAAMRRRSVLAA